jgi:hypothetical protein
METLQIVFPFVDDTVAFHDMFSECILTYNDFVEREEECVISDDETYFDKYDQFRMHLLSRGFNNVGAGSFRSCFARGKIVIKVPENYDGIVDNKVEAAAYRKYKNGPTSLGIMMAPCRLLSNGCLMMAYVHPCKMNPYDDHPQWVKKVEGWQCGYYKGKIVAYDFALSIEERFDWEKEWGTHSEYFHGEHIER